MPQKLPELSFPAKLEANESSFGRVLTLRAMRLRLSRFRKLSGDKPTDFRRRRKALKGFLVALRLYLSSLFQRVVQPYNGFMRAMILSAGYGTRLWPLTEDRTKPALPILGKPLVGYVAEYLAGFGCHEILVNLHHRPESVKAIVGRWVALRCKSQLHRRTGNPGY